MSVNHNWCYSWEFGPEDESESSPNCSCERKMTWDSSLDLFVCEDCHDCIDPLHSYFDEGDYELSY